MKVIKTLSKGVLFLALLDLFAYGVSIVARQGSLGILTEPLRYFIEFPTQVISVVDEITELPPYLFAVSDTFREINLLDKDVFALNGNFEKNKYVFVLRNLRNDSVLHTWWFSKDQFVGSSEQFRVAFPLNPILLDDGSIIGMLHLTNNLFRLDKASNIIWHNTSRVFHHSLNLSPDGKYIWASTWRMALTKNEHSNNATIFQDEILTKIDVKTGKIVLEKSLAEILISNGYINLVHGCVNAEYPSGTDLFHLNDIEPILFDGEYWRKGDLLLSLRHRSMIIHYRPATNKILRIISGPFLAQHDVDVISKNEIAIFNNNRVGTNKIATAAQIKDSTDFKLILKSSNIIIYNFSDSTFRMPFLDLFEREKIYTYRQGAQTFLENGDLFIECTRSGIIYIIRDNKIILRKYANKVIDNGTAEYPNWMRIYEHVNF